MRFIKEPINQFIRLETSGSILLFAATLSALILANSLISEPFLNFWKHTITISIPGFELSKPIIKWINDGLMAIFFFLIGLEIKREILTGELSHLKNASLPFFAAIGGMIVPAVLFTILNSREPGAEGWGIPMATDIAFSLGILKLLGNRVPSGLKTFLMAFAIIGDLGAILVIAIFYSTNLAWTYLAIGLLTVILLIILSGKGYYSKYLFFLAGIIVWMLLLKSGTHSTIAGILMALTIPVKRKTNTRIFYEKGKDTLEKFITDFNVENETSVLTKNQMEALSELEELTEKSASPLQYLEHKLHGWVSFLIMPLFALANAGVVFSFDSVYGIVLTQNIAISLVVGKTFGIFLTSLLTIKLKIASLPDNISYNQLFGVSVLGGLGFTMSHFINNQAYTNQAIIDSAKLGILIGSFIAGLLGYIILRLTLEKSKQ